MAPQFNAVVHLHRIAVGLHCRHTGSSSVKPYLHGPFFSALNLHSSTDDDSNHLYSTSQRYLLRIAFNPGRIESSIAALVGPTAKFSPTTFKNSHVLCLLTVRKPLYTSNLANTLMHTHNIQMYRCTQCLHIIMERVKKLRIMASHRKTLRH